MRSKKRGMHLLQQKSSEKSSINIHLSEHDNNVLWMSFFYLIFFVFLWSHILIILMKNMFKNLCLIISGKVKNARTLSGWNADILTIDFSPGIF